MHALHAFIYFIIFIKVMFVLMFFSNQYLSKISPNFDIKNQYEAITGFWKERTEFIFMVSTSILLILVFYPWRKREWALDTEMRVLFFVFGWVVLLTSNWSLFITEAPWYTRFVKSVA